MIKSLYPIFQRWSATGSIYIISDTHFEDFDCKLMDPNWISPREHIDKIKAIVHRNDTLIHLGDVGNPAYLDELKCYKVLITGNHDVLSKLESHFDEIYTGPLFIADRILLSHEPIFGLEKFCINIHGHDHSKNAPDFYLTEKCDRITHYNLAANVYRFEVFNLGKAIKEGILSNTPNYHRNTIDKATERKIKRKDFITNPFEFKNIIDPLNQYPDLITVPVPIPDPCKGCYNHPSNGGSGICNCTLGTPQVTC